MIKKFQTATPVPQVGWNSNYLCDVQFDNSGDTTPALNTDVLREEVQNKKSKEPTWESWIVSQGRMYFVHSYRLGVESVSRLKEDGWNIFLSRYAGEPFVSYVRKGEVMGTQFHPEKSGPLGLEIIRRFIIGEETWKSVGTETFETKVFGSQMVGGAGDSCETTGSPALSSESLLCYSKSNGISDNGLAKRIIACLDVRELDDGRLAVTKGEQYDVRHDGRVRNLGEPQLLAEKYYNEGADEIIFLSIKSYSKNALTDNPMLELIRETARRVFVPLCVGGGIKDVVEIDPESQTELRIPAVDVAAAYFRAGTVNHIQSEGSRDFFLSQFHFPLSQFSGADKISIGSDAVRAAERLIRSDWVKDGTSSIEQISQRFGTQSVVLSVDAKRVVVESGDGTLQIVWDNIIK